MEAFSILLHPHRLLSKPAVCTPAGVNVGVFHWRWMPLIGEQRTLFGDLVGKQVTRRAIRHQVEAGLKITIQLRLARRGGRIDGIASSPNLPVEQLT